MKKLIILVLISRNLYALERQDSEIDVTPVGALVQLGTQFVRESGELSTSNGSEETPHSAR